MSKKIQLRHPFLLEAQIRADSFDEKENTIDIIFSTGARGLRVPFLADPYYEELSLEPNDVRLEWFNSGKAPMLDSHDRFSTGSIVGYIKENSAKVDGKLGTAKVVLDDSDISKPIVQKVRNKTIKNVSIGYRIYKMEKIGEVDDVPIMRVKDWEPLESSFVSIPFDKGAGVMGRELNEPYECEIINNENKIGVKTMSDENKKVEKKAEETQVETRSAPEPQKETAKAHSVDVEAERKDAADKAVVGERKRIADIQEVCRKANLEDTVASNFIKDGLSIDQARERALDMIAERSNKDQTQSVQDIKVGKDISTESRIEGMSEAILWRSNSAINKLTEVGKPYCRMKLMDMARMCCEANNINTRMLTNDDIAHRAFNSTSDFPLLLANSLNKSLRAGYEATPNTYMPFVTPRPLSDFKTVSSLQAGPAPALLEIGESGEIKSGTITEGQEQYALLSFGRKIKLTRKLIINDDIGFVSTIPFKMGRKVLDLELDQFWSLITTPQTMADGKALFHADHKNLGTLTTAPSIATLGEIMELCREQVDIDGVTKIGLIAQYLVVASADEAAARQLTVAVQGSTHSPATTATVNPWLGQFTAVVEPRLTVLSGSQPHYGFASAAMTPMAEMGYLEGQETGPITSSYVDNETKGVTFDIIRDVVFHVVDYRGFVKIPGA